MQYYMSTRTFLGSPASWRTSTPVPGNVVPCGGMSGGGGGGGNGGGDE